MNNALRVNELKKGHFIKNILKECQQGTDFRIICFDIDNVIINEKNLKEEQIKLIDERATSEYHDRMIKDKTAEDRKEIDREYYDLFDRVLEEVDPEYKGRIDYDAIYNDSNLFKYYGNLTVADAINSLINNRRLNDYFILLSHYNPEREAVKKIQYFSKLFPQIDAIVTVPFHKEPYQKGKNRKMTSKMGYLLLDVLAPVFRLFPNIRNHIYMVDDSRSVSKDTISKSIKSIPYLPSKRNPAGTNFNGITNPGILTDLTPNNLQMAIAYHDYCFNQYSSEIAKDSDFEKEITKIKKKKR